MCNIKSDGGFCPEKDIIALNDNLNMIIFILGIKMYANFSFEDVKNLFLSNQ